MTPDDIKRDKAILDAATKGTLEKFGNSVTVWDDDGALLLEWIPNGIAEDGCNENHEADGLAIETAVNRLPEYIDEAEEMRRRIDALETAARTADKAAKVNNDWGRGPAYRDGLRDALKILRGEK